MSDDSLEQRVETLEQRLETVEETLARYRKQHALLLTDSNVEALDDPACPECGNGTLTKDSGLSWAKAVCGECEATWILSS